LHEEYLAGATMNRKPGKTLPRKKQAIAISFIEKKRAVKKEGGKSCVHLGSLGTLKIEYRACKLKPWQMGLKQSLAFMRG